MGKGSFLSFYRIGIVALVALGAALLIGPRTAFAVEGYWKYDGFRMERGNEYYATVKALPGHVYEVRASPGFQAGPGDARGALDFYFKTDDADLVQYLATSTLTFGANTQLVTLVPGQSVTFEVGLTVSGNDKAGAIQAYGTASMGIDYGDSVQVKTSFKQAASAKGDAIIPGGGPDAIMTIHVNSHLSQLGAMSDALFLSYVWVTGTPPPAGSDAPVSKFGNVLGDTLVVIEMGGGSIYDGTWTRRPGTDIFDAVWNGAVRDVIEIESVAGDQVVLYRHGNKGRYSCTVSPDGLRATSGTASWYPAGWSWSATISSGSPR